MTVQEFKETPQGKALWEVFYKDVSDRWERNGVLETDRSRVMREEVADNYFGLVSPLFIKQQEACDANTESLQVIVDNMMEEMELLRAAK